MNTQVKQRLDQIRRGEVPEGYKKTKVGIVPVEWEECHFKKLFSRLKRKNTENNSNVLTISAQYGLINQEEFFNKPVASDDKSNYYLLYKGDFAYNKSYSTGYPFGAIKSLERYDKGVVSPLYICFSPTDKNKCPVFYLQYFENGLMNHEIKAIAQEGARNHGLLNIGIDDFFNSYLIVPPLPEQQKIAEILTMQDKLIELQARKIEQLQALKKACLQRMFPKKGCDRPEIRFPEFTDAWEQREFGDVGAVSMCKRIFKDETADDGEIPFYKIGTFGSEPDAYISRELYEEYRSKYSYPHKGDILLSASGTIGRIVEYNGEEAYFQDSNIVWLSHDETISNLFLKTLYPIVKWNGIEGSTIKRLYNDNFLKTQFMMPSLAEQTQIGTFFSTLDHLITLHQRKLDEEKQKKKALMQLLLTGTVRVKV